MKTKTLKLMMVALGVLLSINANAYDVEVDGIYYNLSREEKTASVTNTPYYYRDDVVIPESFSHDGVTYVVTEIGNDAFRDCGGLTSVTIPNSVTSIRWSAFSRCSSLTSVHITDIATWCEISFSNPESNPLYYAHHLFLNGKEVKDLVIPNSVTSISNFAFCGCSALTSVSIGNSVTSIGKYAFDGCSGLTSVTIPNSVTSIGWFAFWDCSGLTSVAIPNSVTSISDFAFYGCSGLTSVSIGNSVTSISYYAFGGCSELMDVYCYAEYVPNTDNDVFINSYVEYATLHVPAEAVDAYKNAEPWSGFGTIVALTEEEMKAVGIKGVSEDSSLSIIFTIDGKKTDTLQKGVNIIKMSDGTSKKVFVK